MKICKECRSLVPRRDQFCVYCGRRLHFVPRWAKWTSAAVSLGIAVLLVFLLWPHGNQQTDTLNTLTIAVNDPAYGSVNPTAGTMIYEAGQVVTISATAEAGCYFDHWSGDVVADNRLPTTTVTINGKKTVTANFAKHQLGTVSAIYKVGGSHGGLAADSSGHVWVSDYGSGAVTKLRASDGTVVGTYSVGLSPMGVAYDGANVWVANQGSDSVTKLKASDGTVVGTYSVGRKPQGVAFDGANIWVANWGGSTVTKLRASDGTVVGTYTVISPHALVFDGTNIWVTSFLYEGTVTKLKASDGTVVGAYSVDGFPMGVAFDGANIWVATSMSQSVTKLKASDGTVVGTYSVGVYPEGVAFDGANVWVTVQGQYVVKINASDGSVLGAYTAGALPKAVAFDGENIWVGSWDGSVTKI
jgi:sugar lactone lactonase YvrE